MLQCWQHEPKGRPSFDDIYAKLSELLEATTVQVSRKESKSYEISVKKQIIEI